MLKIATHDSATHIKKDYILTESQKSSIKNL